MIRRLDGLPLSSSQAPSSTNSTEAKEDSRLQPVVRRQLTGLENVSRRHKKADVDTVVGPDEALVSAVVGEAGTSVRSIDDILNAFVMPRLSDAGILRRSLPILRHFVEEIIPQMEGGEHFKEIAAKLVQDEINKHRELFQQRQQWGGS